MLSPEQVQQLQEIHDYLTDSPTMVRFGFKGQPIIQIIPRGQSLVIGYSLQRDVFDKLIASDDRTLFLRVMIRLNMPMLPDTGLGHRVVSSL